MAFNKNYPKISIIIGNHSQRYDVLNKYSVTSVLKSDYSIESIEIIIVDNNCDQNSFEILNEMFSKEKNIKVIKEKRSGICFMRNKGFETSTGDIVAYMDDDCEVDELWLKRIANFYSDTSISFGGGAIFDTQQKKLLRQKKDDPAWPEERRIIGGNMSFRREILDKNKFDTNIIYGKEDFELIYRLLKQNLKYYFDETPIKHHRAKSKFRRINGGSLTLGEKEEEFSELYFNAKKEIFNRYFNKKFFSARHIFTKIINFPLIFRRNKLYLIHFKAKIQAYKDIKRLNKHN